MEVKDIKKIACLGAGTIGHAWATYFIIKGFPTNLYDMVKTSLEESKIKIRRNLTTLAENGIIKKEMVENYMSLIHYTTDIKEALHDVQFIQESLPEQYEIKQNVIKDVDEIINPHSIFATSTSGLLISEIAKYSKHPERIIGGHPWNPPHLLPLVEVVKGEKTSDKTLQITYNFYKLIGKEPVILNKEALGHIANRLQAAVYREIINLVLTGVCTIEDVDKALTFGPGLRWGIFGQALIFHLGGGKNGTIEFMEKIGPSMDLWIADLADWKKVPKEWAKIGHEGVLKEIANRPAGFGNTIETLVKYRDKMLIDLLKLHKKL